MTTVVVASIIVLVVALILGLAYYLWYALALSVVFPRLGSPSWKGWVPIVNEAEILRRGGVPAWSVVYYFIPIVQFYGLYLKITAVHRINLQFHRGSGSTVLAILLPPVWATLLAWGKQPPSEFDQRVSATLPAPAETGVGPLAGGRLVSPPSGPPAARNASGYIVPPPAHPIAPVPLPAVPVEPGRPVETEKPVVALVPEPAAPQPPAAAVTASRESEAPAAPAFIVNPWAKPEPMSEPPVVPEPHAELGDDTAEPAREDDAGPDGDEDEYAATVVVDRRPRVSWILQLEGGKAFTLTSDRVALGRNPADDDAETQLLSVPDSTRTLSKTHAILTLADGEWTVTDLNSTNGVVVVGDDEVETLLAPGRSSLVPGRFILGKVGMSVAFENAGGA